MILEVWTLTVLQSLAVLTAAASLAAPAIAAAPGGTESHDAWKANFNADGTPKPLRDPSDMTLWPNTTSYANSDPWIAKNHDSLRQMRPRLLAINLSNQVAQEKPMQLFNQLMDALEESTRYKGYKDPKAPKFLDYSIWRYVDLRDPDSTTGNTLRSPIKKHVEAPRMNTDYGGFFSQEFAEHIGVRDPKDPSRFLRLDELLDAGYVHEVWITAAAAGDIRMLESVELKPRYDEDFNQVPGEPVQSGNGGDRDQKWTGRSVRLNSINHDRGIGCAMENLAHSMEGMAHGGAIPYFRKYFYEYAMFDLDKRYDLPINSFYPLWGEGKGVSYPNPRTAVATDGEKTWTIENYVAAGGNVHFPPNGRRHYDMANPMPVMSTIEDWRIGSGPGGEDVARPWTNEVLSRYRDLAPDCMGRWIVYWRQNMPMLDNKSKDDEGRPMKNWLPFLFY